MLERVLPQNHHEFDRVIAQIRASGCDCPSQLSGSRLYASLDADWSLLKSFVAEVTNDGGGKGFGASFH
jgi:hypothetical protein